MVKEYKTSLAKRIMASKRYYEQREAILAQQQAKRTAARQEGNESQLEALRLKRKRDLIALNKKNREIGIKARRRAEPWTLAEDAEVMDMSYSSQDMARKIGRSVYGVIHRRIHLRKQMKAHQSQQVNEAA